MQAGEAELVVRFARRDHCQVVPADADPTLRLIAARLSVRAGPEQPARFRLAPGSYLVVGEAGAVLRAVEVGAGTTEVAVD